MTAHIRLRRDLSQPFVVPPLPEGATSVSLTTARPVAIHRLLVDAYATGGGSVGTFDQWFWPLVEDAEFDPSLVLIVQDDWHEPIGLVQCWTSSFIKDIVVAPNWRNRGLGTALLYRAFHVLRSGDNSHVDLKVEAANAAAQRFYRRHGMTALAQS